MTLLNLGLPHRGTHPSHSAHLNEDLWGGLSTSGVLPEPAAAGEFGNPLADIASVTAVAPLAAGASGLSGRVLFKKACDCCHDGEGWDFAGAAEQGLRGGVLSKVDPTAYVVEATAFAALGLGQAILNRLTSLVAITGASVAAGADPEADALITATIA
jgi:hypothetical protein